MNSLTEALRTLPHIIVAGASERPHSLGEHVMSALLSAPFSGSITPVNPRRKTVGGLKSFPNIGKTAEPAAAALILTPPETHEALYKACLKKQIRHAVVIQDRQNLSEEQCQTARQAAQKAVQSGLSVIFANPASIQIPSLPFHTAAGAMPAAGSFAVVSGSDASHRTILSALKQADQGVSDGLCLNYRLHPENGAKLLDKLAENPATQAAVIEFNPDDDLRSLFSAIRRFTRSRALILYCTHAADHTEQAVLRRLGRRCNFLAACSPEELAAAVHAAAYRPYAVQKLHLLADSSCGHLDAAAADGGVRLIRPSENESGQTAYIPADSAVHCRGLADNLLQNSNTEAVLVAISSESERAAATVRTLSVLQRQHGKPLAVCSAFSDGLMQFARPEQALAAFKMGNIRTCNLEARQQYAKPLPSHLKTPQRETVQAASESGDYDKLAKALHLPEHQSEPAFSAARLEYVRHPRYGSVLLLRQHGRIHALLPPFTTADAEFLIRKTAVKRHAKTVHQLLHTLNSLNGSDLPFSVRTDIGSHGISTNFIPESNDAAPNVFASYPDHLAHDFPLKNGQTLHIRPMRPEDAEAKQQFVRNLSPQSRYTRFMTQTNELPPATLTRLSDTDYHSECALAAFDSEGNIAGVCRFSRISDAECEFSISLAENARGQGLAPHLLSTVIQTASKQGYAFMSAEILKNNTAMLKLAEKSGFSLRPSGSDNDIIEARRSIAAPPVGLTNRLKQQILAQKP
ncbi:GNAT family N-acetyltransferase [Neisseria sp.]|uniref:bifunctional acetate--CoA ligase family protein/GNAT family N-acetyltransferase n=1 Tax=Neisseria sp. TaxID=192066 RepID=UPI0035A09050